MSYVGDTDLRSPAVVPVVLERYDRVRRRWPVQLDENDVSIGDAWISIELVDKSAAEAMTVLKQNSRLSITKASLQLKTV